LHYLEWGSETDDRVLLLHGLTGCAESWAPLANHLAEGRHVLALDLRGHGDSQWPDLDSYTTQDFVSDMAGFVESVGIQQMTLIGHSMGARVATAYTASHPEEVSRLVIVDMGPEVNQAGIKRILQQLLAKREEYSSLQEVVDYLALGDPLAKPELLQLEAECVTKRLPNNKLAWKHDGRLEKLISRRDKSEVADWWGLVANITCPTLVVRGSESDFLDSEIAIEMVNTMPQATLVEIERAGHNVPVDNPDRFEEVVSSFLELGE
ncbi:MAG: alpha/beta fold hydrolase, partial [Dehalococcoidia bacterium]|nr:alpha/beta fold hydrolase [Dehalococcoidia bacterium]